MLANRDGRTVVIDASGGPSDQRIITDVDHYMNEQGLRDFEVLAPGNRLTPDDPLSDL